MLMPKPDQAILAKRGEIITRLREIVPGEGVIAAEDERDMAMVFTGSRHFRH